jgi:glyoxylase-like metal-dependent hydrolase (beta-lactamase superfamily II)
MPMVPAGKTVQIAEQVYVIPDQRVSLVPNIGIVVGDAGVLVVDTGMGPANAEIVLAEVRKITDKPIRYLVSTHFHPEHNFGAQAFPDDTVIIYATAQYEDLKNKGAMYRDWFIDMFGDDVRALLEPVEIVPPDVTFERKAEINLGDRLIELHFLGKPAHTGGDTVIYLPDAKIIFTGGLTPNRFFPIMPDPDSSGAGWIASLEQLQQMDIETVVPGHGEIADVQLIAQVKDYLTSLRARVEQLRAADQSLEQIQAALEPEFEANYSDWEETDWISMAVERFYTESAGAE